MERKHLAELLGGGGEIFQLCRSTLAGGAEFKVWDQSTSTRQLASIYARRMRTINRTGQPSIGFAEAVASLKGCSEAELAIAYVDGRPDGGYYFQLFLTADLGAVVACLGVRSSPAVIDPVDPQ